MCSQAANWDSKQSNGLRDDFYLTAVAEFMLSYILWTDVRIHNGGKGTVLGFIYKNYVGPRSGEFP